MWSHAAWGQEEVLLPQLGDPGQVMRSLGPSATSSGKCKIPPPPPAQCPPEALCEASPSQSDCSPGQQPWVNGVSYPAEEERKGGWEGRSGDRITQLLPFSCKATECLQVRPPSASWTL